MSFKPVIGDMDGCSNCIFQEHTSVTEKRGFEGMEIFIDIIKQGNIKIEVLARDHDGCSVIFTITDEEDRRILKSAIMENGKVKVYASAAEAIKDAILKLNPHPEEQ